MFRLVTHFSFEFSSHETRHFKSFLQDIKFNENFELNLMLWKIIQIIGRYFSYKTKLCLQTYFRFVRLLKSLLGRLNKLKFIFDK